jgi:hypothetical protein
MAHPPSESANGRTNPASSRNLKPPALAGGVFTVFQQVLSTYDAGKQLAPNTPPPSDGKRGDANPQSTTKFAGSSTPPVELGTELIPTSTDSAEHQNTSAEAIITFTALSSATVNPTQLPNSQAQIPTILTQAAPTTVAITSPAAIGNVLNQSEVSSGFIISGTATAGAAPVNGQTVTIAIVNSSNVVKDAYTTTVTNGSWSVNIMRRRPMRWPTASTASRRPCPVLVVLRRLQQHRRSRWILFHQA